MAKQNIRKQLNKVTQESQQHLNQFRKTKELLEGANQQLTSTIEDIDAEIEVLKQHKAGAMSQLADNEGAIKGINRLLDGGQ
ncbi:hypothetical protein [Halobacillus ihumii]|uniref:hypothetical protein n=1 Tax=Halobacillus ihumii TaxID=2686092 RepID=UPI0013D5ED84|nr:hypothetical protein [Halobacillus ihumii]